MRRIIQSLLMLILTTTFLLFSPVMRSSSAEITGPDDYPPDYWRQGIIYSKPLPWNDAPQFRQMISENKNMVLMAKYQATLKEPLPGEMNNVGLAADKLAGTMIPDGKVFSQNREIGPYTSANGYQSGPMYKGTKIVTSTGGGVCKIASVLYNLAILSNLPVYERYNHSMTVPYVPPGQDATVSYGVKDIRFLNNTGGPIVIWAETVGNTLYMAFYGQEIPPQVTWHHQELKRIKYWTVYRYNENLGKGIERLLVTGQDGLVVKSWITIEYPDGETKIKELGKNYYDALPEIIEKGR